MANAKVVVATAQRKREPFAGWRMAVIASLAQNAALGMSFGVYGPLVIALQTKFLTSRALAASGLSVMTLVMGLVSPAVGSLTRAVSLRTLMVAGAILAAAGYLLLTEVTSIYALLAIYAFVIGPAVCLLGVIPSSTLVSNWFFENRGKILGFVNMPLFICIFPFISASIMVWRGADAVFLTISALFACLIPVLMLVVSRPDQMGQRSFGDEKRAEFAVLPARSVPMQSKQILTNRPFLILSLGIGTLTAGGVMMVTHLVPLALDKGLSLRPASLLLSAFGIAATAGALIFGWLADKFSARIALAILSLLWTAPWTALLVVGPNYPVLIVISGAMGLCSGAIVGLCGTAMNEWLGQENFGRAMGYCYLIKVPFMFGAAPLAGYMRDVTGGYKASITLHIVSFLVVGFVFAVYRPQKKFTVSV